MLERALPRQFYRNKFPSSRCIGKLLLVPSPKRGQFESSIYAPFLDALDKCVTEKELRQINARNPQTLRFLQSTKLDVACESLNENVSTYWGNEYPSTFSSQQEIYRKKEKEKIPHIASMRLGGDVDLMVTESQKWMPKKYREMVRHCVVLETVARSLSTFTWCKMLLSCIADAVEGVQQAYNAGILHGNLSVGNIMIIMKMKMKMKEWHGVLVDWDMHVLWQNKKGKARNGRTGTWGFISAKILLSPGPCPHTLGDDIESAF